LSSENLNASGLDYAALGHYHTAVIHPGQTVIAYSGNIEGKRFGEEGPRHFLHVVLDTDAEPAIEKIECQQRLLKDQTVLLSDLPVGDQAELVAHLKTLVEPSDIVRFTLSGDPGFPVDATALQDVLRESFYFVEVRDRSSFTSDARVLAARDEGTVRGVFVRRMLELIETEQDEEGRHALQAALKEGFRALEGGRP
jgi:DNA repair exonuclease SbcCD nuclease subunit